MSAFDSRISHFVRYSSAVYCSAVGSGLTLMFLKFNYFEAGSAAQPWTVPDSTAPSDGSATADSLDVFEECVTCSLLPPFKNVHCFSMIVKAVVSEAFLKS